MATGVSFGKYVKKGPEPACERSHRGLGKQILRNFFLELGYWNIKNNYDIDPGRKMLIGNPTLLSGFRNPSPVTDSKQSF